MDSDEGGQHMTDRSERIAQLEAERDELVFRGFDHTDAWRLGVLLTERALEASLRVAIDIRRPGLILFRSALPGTAPDQEAWISAKSATALRMEASTALIAERHARDGVDAAALGWLAFPDFVVAGGSVPVRVAGVGVVATVTASGLASDDDHQLVVDGIRAFLATQ
jgi:uncharacterized protein (UPF0303 family)